MHDCTMLSLTNTHTHTHRVTPMQRVKMKTLKCKVCLETNVIHLGCITRKLQMYSSGISTSLFILRQNDRTDVQVVGTRNEVGLKSVAINCLLAC